MSDVFGRDSIFSAYIKWHYGQGLKELFGVAGNFLWFITHFFSFKLLLKTLLAPWKRLRESYGERFDISAYASAFVVNILMRVMGFCTKVIVLGVGLISYLVVLAFSIGILMIWILAPAVLIGSAVLSATFFVI